MAQIKIGGEITGCNEKRTDHFCDALPKNMI